MGLLTLVCQEHCCRVQAANPQRHPVTEPVGTNKLLKNGLYRKWQKQCVSSPSAGIESQRQAQVNRPFTIEALSLSLCRHKWPTKSVKMEMK